jgi:hypothetical protein
VVTTRIEAISDKPRKIMCMSTPSPSDSVESVEDRGSPSTVFIRIPCQRGLLDVNELTGHVFAFGGDGADGYAGGPRTGIDKPAKDVVAAIFGALAGGRE